MEQNTTNLPESWDRYSIELEIIPELEGQLIQYGFANTAGNFAASGVLYDNVRVEPTAEYSQDFESLDMSDPVALENDGWVFFGNVFDSTGEPPPKITYGPFGAPNAAVDPATIFISAIVSGEGGGEQGNQQLSIFNDYNCCTDSGDDGHFNGTDRVEMNVFRERTITAADVGNTIVFSFDGKRGNINDGCPEMGTGGMGGSPGTAGMSGAGGAGAMSGTGGSTP